MSKTKEHTESAHVEVDVKFVTIIRPDGTKLFLNTNQIVYITPDATDPSGAKTQILTTEGSFIVKKNLEEVKDIVLGLKDGNL